jgi:hypothetical protein
MIVLGACSSEPKVPTTLTLSSPSLSFSALGQSQQLTPSVTDQNGDPLPGTSVSWASSNAAVASVSSTGVVTAEGAGSAQVTAAAGSATAVADVTVVQTPTQLNKISGDGQTATAGEALDSPLVVEVNDALGNPVAGAAVTFAITQGGGSLAPANATTSTDGRASTTVTAGTVAGSPQQVSASIAATTISVSFNATATAGPPATISIAAGNNQQALPGDLVPVRPAVSVRDIHQNPVPGISVEFEVISGGGSITGGTTVTNANGRAEVGSWRLGTGTPNELRASAVGLTLGGNPVTFTASTATTALNIEVRFLTSATAAQADAFTSAEQRWETLVVGDLEDVLVNEAPGVCGGGTPAINEALDDLIIFAMLEPIDGPGAILGQAGPCLVRENFLPAVGVMFFDSEDLDFIQSEGLLEDLILHEMGHVLGFGTLWPFQGLLANPAANGGTDPHFTGAQAIAAFNSAGGAGYTGAKVPVEDTGGEGTVDSHWRESVFDNELMTGFINVGNNRLSAISVASLADQGFQVDVAEADPYSVTSALRVQGPRKTLKLTNDIIRRPVKVLDARGRLVRTLRR